MVGDVVRQTRIEAGMTQGDLADAAGVSTGYLSQIESGGGRRTSQRPKSPSAEVWHNLSTALPELAARIGALPPDVRPEQWPGKGGDTRPLDLAHNRRPRYRLTDAEDPLGSSAGADALELLDDLLRTHRIERLQTLLDSLARHLAPLGEDQVDGRVAALLEAATALVTEDGSIRGSRLLIANAPLDVERSVWLEEVGRDADGALFLNPGAATLAYLPANESARILRTRDGRILAQPAAGADLEATFDPDTHTLRVFERAVWPGAAIPYTDFAETEMTITLDSGAVRLRPLSGPKRVEGAWPAEGGDAIHILTAANPDMQRFTDSENSHRMDHLRSFLDNVELPWVPARSHAPNVEGAFDEEGVALLGTTRAAALSLAGLLDQTSIFEWTREYWAVVAIDETTVRRGWQTSAVSD